MVTPKNCTTLNSCAKLFNEVNMQNNEIPGSHAKIKKISFNFLIWLYIIIPICIIAYLVDIIFLHGYLKETLPIAPESYLILSLIFGTPHIIASNIIFITNKDYLETYGFRAATATFGII